MAKFTDMLNIGFKPIRVPAFIKSAVTRDKYAYFSRFCRYSCISDNINNIIR